MVKISKIFRSTKYDNQLALCIRGGGVITYPEGIKLQTFKDENFVQITDPKHIQGIIDSFNNKMERFKDVYGVKVDSRLVEYVGAGK